MGLLANAARSYSKRARRNRDKVFQDAFPIRSDTKVLDLGSENGQHISDVLSGTGIDPKNVYIADISTQAVQEGNRRFGFTPVSIEESGALPFPDKFFDVVYCSSVLEHVTVPKSEVWSVRSGRKFRQRASESQRRFAEEIKRLGKQYYVQTPNKWFVIESHSWLPFVGWLPRRVLIPTLRLTNRFWVKATSPDWHLLDEKILASLFDDGSVVRERFLGLTKSLTAVKSVSA